MKFKKSKKSKLPTEKATTYKDQLDQLDQLNRKYKDSINNAEFVHSKAYYDLLKSIESLKTKIAQHASIYPSIYDPDFNTKISKKREFSIYKIKPKNAADIYALYNSQEIQQSQQSTQSYNVFQHKPTQKFLSNFFNDKTPYRGLLIIHGTGVGKCHAVNTRILMANGSIKLVQDLIPGDQIMGDDSMPRTILSTTNGQDIMYEVIPTNSSFKPYKVNSEHILCLKNINDSSITEISINRYLALTDGERQQLYGYRMPIIEFHNTQTPTFPIDCAYELGFKLDEDDVEHVRTTPLRNRLEYIAGVIDGYNDAASHYSSIGNEIYTGHSIIINLCGFCKHFISKFGFIVLSTGLGFQLTNLIIKITGNLAIIPTRNIKLEHHISGDPLDSMTAINIRKLEDERDYYGFTVDGNGRYMLADDLTVTHNTCTAITIAEQFKQLAYKNDRKIHIIRYEEFQQQMFDVQKVANGMDDDQCTGTTYLAEVDNKDIIEQCHLKKACEGLQMKITKTIKKYYDFSNIETWARNVSKLIYKKGHDKATQEAHEYKVRHIRKYFNDTMIIIDEAHHINDETNARNISKVLTDVLQYAENLRLVMLSATPMFDKPEDIISLINYLLINDKRPRISERIFNADGMLTDEGRLVLEQKSRGYISYLRGSNPVDFPIRLSAKMVLPTSDFLNLKKYPTIPPEFQNIKHDMKFMELVDCRMSKEQKKVYQSIEKTSAAWSEESQISNFIYQTLDEAGSNIRHCYGDGGFRQVIKDKKSPPYQFNSPEYGKRFQLPELATYSSKIAKIIELIKTATGPVFIFTQWIDGGLYPLIMALEMNGYRGYKGSTFIENPHKSTDSLGEYIVKSGSYNSPHLSKYLNKREAMVKENVRVFLATSSASEGLNLFGYREAHILDPHFNLSRLEQAVGRTIRFRSHMMLPPQLRNVTVYMYAATIANTETVDLYKYRISELKAITTGQVEKILKENAIDCILNKADNEYSARDYSKQVEMYTSQNKKVKVSLNDVPFSRACNYMESCEFKCTQQHSGSNDSNVKELDVSSMQLKHLDKDINYVMKTAIKIISKYNIVHLDELRKMFNVGDQSAITNDAFDLAMYKIVDSKNSIMSSNGVYGKIIKFNDYMRFIPDYYKDDNIEFQFQYKPLHERISDFDLRNYITKLKRFRDVILENKESNYDSLIVELTETVNNIHNKTASQDYAFNDSIKLNEKEILDFILQRYQYQPKMEIVTTLFHNLVKPTSSMTDMEKYILDYIKHYHLIYYDDIFPDRKSHDRQIYGLVIAKGADIETYIYNQADNKLVKELAANKKFIDNRKRYLTTQVQLNKVYGYLSSDKVEYSPAFKIVDLTIDEKKFNKGGKCIDKNKNYIMKYINQIQQIKLADTDSKSAICYTYEMILRKLDKNKFKSMRWFLSPEEYIIMNYKI
jgi:hypothetical protein